MCTFVLSISLEICTASEGRLQSAAFSSITNAMAFLIGMTSQTPAVRSFSLYSAIAISICFLYQLIMFSAVLAASGYRERSGLQSLLCWRKANPKVGGLHGGEIVTEVILSFSGSIGLCGENCDSSKRSHQALFENHRDMADKVGVSQSFECVS